MKLIHLIILFFFFFFILPIKLGKSKMKTRKNKKKRCSDYMPKVTYPPGTSPMDNNPPSVADVYLDQLRTQRAYQPYMYIPNQVFFVN